MNDKLVTPAEIINMKKNIAKVSFIVFLTQFLLAVSYAKNSVPTSDIPMKREFPVNSEVNPCDNFHAYVCSIAESQFKLRDDRSRHTFSFNDSRERLLDAKKNFMKNISKEKSLSQRGTQIKNFYTSCMNIKSRAIEEKEKISRLKKELAEIKDAKSFMLYLNSQTQKGESSLISFWDRPNMDDPLKLNLLVSVGLMDLPDHTYYEKSDVILAYQNLLTTFFKTVNPDETQEQASARAEKQIILQKDFIKTYPVASIRRQRYSEKRTSTQVEVLKKYIFLNLDQIFKNVPAQSMVNIPIPESMDYLNANMNNDKLDILKDFYLYRVASDLMDEAYPKYFESQFNFEKNFFGGPQLRPDLQERCTTTTSQIFQLELDQILIDRLFPGFKDEKVLALGDKIRGSIILGLERNKWLSTQSKSEAIRKVKTARLQLVRPQNEKEWDFIPVQKYSPRKFLDNKRVYSLARFKKSMEDLKYPANQLSWGMGPLTVNAYYSGSENKFVLPIGILQYPFYDKEGDMLENLGAVGAVIGHELGHGIDDQGSKYNADGKLHDWMSMRDKAEFSQRGQKMIDLFNKVGHDGLLTQGENIADLVGLTFAYQAAFPDNKGGVEDKKRFFSSYGRLWCTVSRPDFDKMLLKTDPHAAGWARINEQVKHQPGFSEVFQCKPGDKMFLSEKDRVQIW